MKTLNEQILSEFDKLPYRGRVFLKHAILNFKRFCMCKAECVGIVKFEDVFEDLDIQPTNNDIIQKIISDLMQTRVSVFNESRIYYFRWILDFSIPIPNYNEYYTRDIVCNGFNHINTACIRLHQHALDIPESHFKDLINVWPTEIPGISF